MVQITVASQHSLKLHYLIRVIEILYKLKINITVLDIVVVVPPSVVSTFHMSSSQVMSDKHQTIRVRVRVFVMDSTCCSMDFTKQWILCGFFPVNARLYMKA
jgi:hypothetical protein